MTARTPHATSAPRTGTLAGLALAALLLAATAYLLLRPDQVTVKALVPVWLAALPVAGICAALGYAAGRAFAGRSPDTRAEVGPGEDPIAHLDLIAVPTVEPEQRASSIDATPTQPHTSRAPIATLAPDPGPETEPTAPPEPSASPWLRLGIALERGLTQIEAFAARGPLRAIGLGVALGAGSVVGGIALFLLVWYILVNVFA